MIREPRRQRTYFILLLVTAFALLTIDYHSNGTSSPLHPFEAAVAGVVGPGEKAVSSVVKPLTDDIHFGKQPDKVAELEKELAAAQSLAETSQNDHRIVAQLDALLGWPPYYVDRMLPARVVANGDTLTAVDDAVTIDAGSRVGVHVNMTVVAGLGLIGNIVAVSATTSTVQLLIDPLIKVVARNARTNTVGIVTGRPDGDLDLTQISQTSDIRVGDQLETLGSQDNSPYVPDVPIGTVISVDNTPGAATHTAVVRPFASFENLDLVAIIFPPTTPLPRHFLVAPITAGPTTTAPPTSPSASAPAGSASASGQVSSTVTSAPAHTTAPATPKTTPSRTPTTSPPVTSHSSAPTSARSTSPSSRASKTPSNKPTTTKPSTSKPATHSSSPPTPRLTPSP